MDPSVVVYGSMSNNQHFGEADGNMTGLVALGNMAEAVALARVEGYRLMVISDEMERVTRDWIALGDLDRLINPQLVMASNIDELVFTGSQ